MRIGAVDEAGAGVLAVVAARNHGGVHAVHVHGQAGVEHVALAVEILAPGLDAVLDDAAVQLVHVLETLLQEVGTGFFALHAAGAVGQNFLIPELLEALKAVGKVAEIFNIRPHEKTGQHLSPEEFRALKDRDDVVVVDVRSDYEYNLGRFKNAVTLDMENFRDFPERVARLKEFKDKKILTYCTGGVKCEKASAFLLEQGFENVYQLHGGIIKYGIEAGGEDFDGQCYVFDNRVAVAVNRVNPTVISRCQPCQQPSNRLVNCANPHCNAHVPLCEACGDQLQGACSVACAAHPDKRPYDGTGAYPKLSNHYKPAQGLASYAK